MQNMVAERSKLPTLGSVAAAFDLLEVLGRRERAMAISDLARTLKRPKSSVHRVLTTLARCGYVEQEREHGRYRLTAKLWRVGSSAFHGRDLVETARADLEDLMVSSDETVHLAVVDGESVVYIHKVESPRSIRVQTRIGAEAPLTCTATGRALLEYRPALVDQVLSKPIHQRTAATVTNPDLIREAIEHARETGIAVTKCENHPEMGGIAAPIFDFSGDAVASTGVAIPAFRMNDDLVERCIPLVRRAARRISRKLGFDSA